MKGTALVCALLACSAIASLQDAQHDIVVPEAATELPTAQQDFLVESYAKAKQTVKQLADTNACKDLADDTEKDVKASVKSQQSVIDSMKNGTECAAAGDVVLELAKTALDDAQKAYDNSTSALSAAKDKTIDLGKLKWSDMVEQECSSKFFKAGPWADQKKAVDEATTANSKASGALDEAKKARKDAGDKAADLVAECRCNVLDAYEAAIIKANADVKELNEKTWTQAAHIRCVANGTKLDQCKVSDCPTVVAKTLSKGTECNRLGLADDNDGCDGTCQRGVYNLLSIKDTPAGCTNAAEWKATDMSAYTWKMCSYTTAAHPTTAQSFHSKCDGYYYALLTVAKGRTTGEQFGAFQAHGCHSGNHRWMAGGEVKLFNLDHKWVFPRKASYSGGRGHDIYCTVSYGPTFGGGHDFNIKNAGTKDSYFSPGTSYQTCQAKAQTDRNSNTYMTGMKNQEIDYYVYRGTKV